MLVRTPRGLASELPFKPDNTAAQDGVADDGPEWASQWIEVIHEPFLLPVNSSLS